AGGGPRPRRRRGGVDHHRQPDAGEGGAAGGVPGPESGCAGPLPGGSGAGGRGDDAAGTDHFGRDVSGDGGDPDRSVAPARGDDGERPDLPPPENPAAAGGGGEGGPGARRIGHAAPSGGPSLGEMDGEGGARGRDAGCPGGGD